MNVVKRFATAVNSSSLQSDENHNELDIIAAVALSSDLGSTLFRVKFANDGASLLPLIIAWRIKVGIKAAKRGWAKQAHLVADTSLQYWLNDVCKACEGRGHPKIVNAPTLKACTCPECDGAGKRPLRCDQDIAERVKDAIQALNTLERIAGAAAIRKLSDEVRF